MGTDPPGRMIRTDRTGRRRGSISPRAGTGRDSVELAEQTAIPREPSSGGGTPAAQSRSFAAWCRPDGEPAMELALRHGPAARAGLMETLAALTVVGRIIEPCRHRRW